MADIVVLSYFRPPPSPSTGSNDLHHSISLLLRRNLSVLHLKQIQAQLFRRSLHDDRILLTQLVSGCSSAGAPAYATRLFLSLPEPDLVLLNAMLRAYTLNSLHRQAVAFYVRDVLGRGFAPDRFTFPYVLKACAALRDLSLGRQIHGSLVKLRETSVHVIALNSLVDMYFKCRENEAARKVFQAIEEPNSTSWNMLMTGLLNSGDVNHARHLFDQMPRRDVVSWNSLLSAYAWAGDMNTVQELFDEMPERDSVSWNVLIAGYTENGQNDKALSIFEQMITAGFRPDNATLLSAASACTGACSVSENVLNHVISCLKSANSASVSTALLSLCAKVGRVDEARSVFEQIPEKDLVAWNAMIAAYAQNQRPVEAIELFKLMQGCSLQVGVMPDSVTMISLINCCAQIGILSLGEWIHAYIRRNGIECNTILSTALIDMYANCGDIDRSQHLFSDMPEKDLATWNAMIKGLAIHGRGLEALELFSSMENHGPVPNEVTFIGLLTACSHGGLIAEGLKLLELLQKRYGLVPCIEHYGSVVDLLGRAGKLSEAYELIENMPIKPDVVVWSSLLSACQSYRNVELAEKAAQKVIELDPGNDSHYVLLSNVYASRGKWTEAAQVRALMKACRVQKKPGCSAVELDGVVHEFEASDQ
ncbi:pentatricopeptide repeat-containing protein At1g08070, chloroplastic-like [Zingiber officinale]|uniref:Pentatricopeptide repeat-containing protein n=1 Tax=Zingiber officinale TaxID=94328 RepID=A0A8J5E8P5_ZINOF|nr:pentatricopeptide repeat-containing protein At1g08070, chloroplastic-like [Zingiber officinale]KAG6467025.1 hypothetical protein ZIOFF_075210 [Zingiber officinale]